MSIGKTLIQKEIDRQNRAIGVAEQGNKMFKNKLKVEKGDNKILNGWIKINDNAISASKKNIKELEADIKKL